MLRVSASTYRSKATAFFGQRMHREMQCPECSEMQCPLDAGKLTRDPKQKRQPCPPDDPHSHFAPPHRAARVAARAIVTDGVSRGTPRTIVQWGAPPATLSTTAGGFALFQFHAAPRAAAAAMRCASARHCFRSQTLSTPSLPPASKREPSREPASALTATPGAP